jgi:hypothetical protein
MKRYFKSLVTVVAAVCTMSFEANAQVCSYPNGFSGTPTGVPCSYSTSSTSNPGIGCWGEASCNNGRQLSVSMSVLELHGRLRASPGFEHNYAP